jgi:hypothetical protein
MAVPTQVYVYKDASIEIDEVEYTNQCTRAVLIPTTPIQSVRTLVPDGQVQDVDSPMWVFGVSALQKNHTGGLAKALRSAAPGAELDVVLIPQVGLSMPQATFTIKALPVQFGGEQGKFMDFEEAFPVVGQPVFGDTPAS